MREVDPGAPREHDFTAPAPNIFTLIIDANLSPGERKGAPDFIEGTKMCGDNIRAPIAVDISQHTKSWTVGLVIDCDLLKAGAAEFLFFVAANERRGQEYTEENRQSVRASSRVKARRMREKIMR